MRFSYLRVFATVIFIALTASACSGDPDPSDSNSIPTNNLTEAQQLIAEAVVHCSDTTQCSPSVGMLIGATPTAAYQCTSFLIAPNIVATNSHCVPDDLKTPGSNCQGRVELLFPSLDGYAEVRAGCTTVLQASQIDSSFTHSDYAFLQLDTPIARPALSITPEGLADSQVYTITKIDPYQGNGVPEGYMHQDHCKVVYDSLLAQEANYPQAPVMVVGDCTVVEGNSGSPLTDSSGNVPAVIFAKMNSDDLSGIIAADGIPSLSGSLAPLGLATNYACVQVPGGAASSSPACQSGYQGPDPAGALEQQTNRDLQTRFNQAQGHLDPSAKWTLTTISGESWDPIGGLAPNQYSFIALATPNCVDDVNQFLARTKGALGTYPSSGTLSLDIPFWSVEIQLNSYLQETYAITEAPATIEQEMSLQLDPGSLHAKDGSTAQTISVPGTSSPLYSGQLGACVPAPH